MKTAWTWGPWTVAVLLTAAVSCGGCNSDRGGAANSTTTAGGSAAGEKLTGKIAIDGSSTVFPVMEAIAEEFRNVQPSVQAPIGIAGTGGGFKKFCRGDTDISNASRPILEEEMTLAKENGIEYIELPICFDALTVAVHKDNDWVDAITVDELKKIWEPEAEGKVMRWNQVRPEWPNEEFKLYGAGTDSGTFDYFTEAICGKAKSSRTDFTPSEDDNTLVQGIEGNKYSLGYIPYAYYQPNTDKMTALKIDWKPDDELGPIGPSAETVVNGTYNPLSRPMFLYINKKSAERPEVKAFVEFLFDNIKELSTEVGYMPLPDKAYEMGRARFEQLQTGTGFGGVPEVGLPVEDILKREPKS
ncbi:MAG TPA: PstS family phosphate ABC transporter substrate-binding protein [Pirellulaceae bacterium]|nr:PstS family phosphate ABC transporter substrate-binding protein [Pirellulaceae bacterium]